MSRDSPAATLVLPAGARKPRDACSFPVTPASRLHRSLRATAGAAAAEVYSLNLLVPEIEDRPDNTTRFLVIGRKAVVLVAAAVVFVVYRMVLASIQKPVRGSTQAAKLIAAGDLATHVALDPGRTDSLGALQEALQTMREGLNSTVSSVRLVADNVSNASAEIAQGNHDLSARTESQASALEETAASMEELTSVVNQNAQAAQQAERLAQQAAEVAERGPLSAGSCPSLRSSVRGQ